MLSELLAEAGDSKDTPIPVAIETPRGLLVAALRATGRRVYTINPMAVARYRERWTVARSKIDHADAVALANILRTDAHAHRPLPADSELAQAVAVLARAHQERPGDAPRPCRNSAPICGSTTPASSMPSPPPASRTWPAPTPARYWPSRRPRPRAPRSPAHGSLVRYAAAAANATSTGSPTNSAMHCDVGNCTNPHWSSRRWAPRRWPCWQS
jgi:hypothetical protein